VAVLRCSDFELLAASDVTLRFCLLPLCRLPVLTAGGLCVRKLLKRKRHYVPWAWQLSRLIYMAKLGPAA
jgi:hypothetical protein